MYKISYLVGEKISSGTRWDSIKRLSVIVT
jgi:hypothetical protein